MFGIHFLTQKDGIWRIVGDGDSHGRELGLRCGPLYIAREDGWYEVAYGPTDAESSNWVARDFGPAEKTFALEEGMAVKHFGGDLDYTGYFLEPAGRCVCTLSVRGDDGYPQPLTKLALDLKHPPFAAHHWPFSEDGGFRPVDEIDLSFDMDEDYALTKEFFGEIDDDLWFWIIMI